MSLDELNQKLTAVVDAYVAAASAAQRAYNAELQALFAAAEAADIDAQLLGAVVNTHMQRMEQSLAQALKRIEEETP